MSGHLPYAQCTSCPWTYSSDNWDEFRDRANAHQLLPTPTDESHRVVVWESSTTQMSRDIWEDEDTANTIRKRKNVAEKDAANKQILQSAADKSILPTRIYLIQYHATYNDGTTATGNYQTIQTTREEADEFIVKYARPGWEKDRQIVTTNFNIHEYALVPF